MSSQMWLTVGQLAKLTGITVRTLHHYDARGLLTPSHRSDAGYRLYAQGDVVRLFRIQALQRVGLSLAEIAEALQRDSASLADLIAQQLGELDEQIARSTLVRDQLRRLHERLAGTDAPQMHEWLRALELLSMYDKHCTVEELDRLIDNNNDADWRPFIRDLKSALDRGLDPESEEAASIAHQWVNLAMRRFGSDPMLAKKMKQAYLDDPSLQARVLAQSGFDPKMLQFCLKATVAAHLRHWRRVLSAEEATQLRLTDEWGRECMEVAAQLRLMAQSGESYSRSQMREMRERWQALLCSFAGGNAALASKIETALRTDADLRLFWSLTVEELHMLELGGETESIWKEFGQDEQD